MPSFTHEPLRPVEAVDVAVACDVRLGDYFRGTNMNVAVDHNAVVEAMNGVADTGEHDETVTYLSRLVFIATDIHGVAKRNEVMAKDGFGGTDAIGLRLGVFDTRTKEILVAIGGAAQQPNPRNTKLQTLFSTLPVEVTQTVAAHELRHALEDDDVSYYIEEATFRAMNAQQPPKQIYFGSPQEQRARAAEAIANEFQPIITTS